MLQVLRRECGLCGSQELALRYSEEWRGQHYAGYYCGACELFQTLGCVDDISPEYTALSDSDLTETHVALQTSGKQHAFGQWARLMTKVGGAPPSGKLLDIGCGIGGFLDEAEALGLDVHGYDASAAQVAAARGRHQKVGNFIHLEDYASTLPGRTRFDFVTMWDVLEHVRAPGPLLTDIRGRLADDGLLFVSVPAGGPIWLKLAFARLFRRSPGLQPWEHVFYYSPRSLRLLFELNGFEVLEINGVVTYPRKLSLHEVIRRAAASLLRRTSMALQIYAVVRRKP